MQGRLQVKVVRGVRIGVLDSAGLCFPDKGIVFAVYGVFVGVWFCAFISGYGLRVVFWTTFLLESRLNVSFHWQSASA
jgi:hypothetical protein